MLTLSENQEPARLITVSLTQGKQAWDRKDRTKMLLVFPPSSVTSRLESAASTSSTSDSQVKSWASDDSDSLLT